MCDIPIYNDYDSNKSIINNFYEKAGCLIIKNVFTTELMSKYNNFCYENFEDVLNNQENCSHPKQKDKITINDLLERLSKQDPELLIKLINNNKLNKVLDILLGFACIGSMSTHCIKPGGKRQKSHVDYPLHIGSGLFWENNKIDEYLTDYQINNILPYYSIQCFIASDACDEKNGSTEVMIGSHLITDVGKKILDNNFYRDIEDKFINVKLEKGDVLLFNRDLIHRGGFNQSKYNRNSCIIQYVWLFGIPQAIRNSQLIFNNLENELNKLNNEEKKKIKYRIRQPYPIDVTKHN
jgi:ectoine hydroxylase-related dioxygenase (phytanoyl-CoA dioxygenase family)